MKTLKYNGVWSDMTLEQTYNKEAKIQFFLGITQKPNTVKKYLRAMPSLTTISEETKMMAHMKQSEETKFSDSSDALRDDAVKRIVTIIKERKINPLIYNGQGLVSISPGQLAGSADIIKDKEIGLNVLNKCEMDRLPKLEPVLLKPFIQMHTCIISSVKKAKAT